MAKKIITEFIKNIETWQLEGKIENVIKFLNDLKTSIIIDQLDTDDSKSYIDIEMKFDHIDYETYEINVYGMRYETDDEHTHRLAKEASIKLKRERAKERRNLEKKQNKLQKQNHIKESEFKKELNLPDIDLKQLKATLDNFLKENNE